jgi:class 3 adenylate cyclase/tetratricopeptide (TPR) repeat protein
MSCPTCSRPIPDGARFCPSCGTPVATAIAGAAGEERRVVTVLFADLVGFTALAEHRDPEQIKRLVDAAFERLVADVVRFGGRVDKVLGDAIIALFGAPVAHEDDAERAVRTALRMQQTLAEFVHGEMSDEQIRMRIGINTGEVLVGSLAGSDYTAMGDVMNTASRIQAAAPPGGVLVADATRELCSDTVLFEPVEPLHPRGREEPVVVWTASGIAAPAGARPTRVDPPFVGRPVGLRMLRAMVDLITLGRSALLAVVGEAGIGKTRLIDEITGSLGDVVVLRGACAPYGEANVWWPVASAIAERLGLRIDADGDEIRRVARTKGVALLGIEPSDADLDRFIEALTYLLGKPSALDRLDVAGARDQLYETVTEVIRRRTERAPLVLWIDDLQWADRALLELLELVIRSLPDSPFLLATAHRTDADIAWPPQIDRSIVVTFPLRPLSREESNELVDEVLGRPAPARLHDRLYERAGGNPLFLIELAQRAASAGDAELPGTLRALIAARLDELSPAQRALVDNAAVLGIAGPLDGLATFADKMRQPFSSTDIDELVVGGWFRLTDGWWRFRSDVVREVAYQTLTKQARAQRHAGVAAALSEGKGALDDLAHHTATAAELVAELGSVPGVPPSVRPKAIELLLRAARHAFDRGSLQQAVRHATRGLALVEADSPLRSDLLLVRADANGELRQFADVRADGTTLLALAGKDRVREAEARRVLGTLAHFEGDLTTARRELGRSVELLRDADDRPRLARALRARGFAEVFGGALNDAEWFLGEADGLSAELGDRRGRAWVQQHRAWIAFLSGDHHSAEQQLESAAASFEQLGDRGGVGWAKGLLAFVRYFQRRFDEAEQLAKAVHDEAERRGEEWPAAMMLTLRANMRLWDGRFAEAEQYAERARGVAKRLGDRFALLQTLAPLNRSRVALGKVTEVERGVEEALAIADTFREMAFPLQAAAGVAMHLGDGPRAVELTERAIERLRSAAADTSESDTIRAIGLCLDDRADDALSVLLDVHIEHPFPRSARALARVLTADFVGALADADAVEAAIGASYFDRSIAAVAAAAAAAGRGDAGELRERLARLQALADTDDVVVGALIGATIAKLCGHPSSVDELGAFDSGWRRLVDRLPGLADTPV